MMRQPSALMMPSIYEELDLKPSERRLPSEVLLPEEAIQAFQDWTAKTDKVEY